MGTGFNIYGYLQSKGLTLRRGGANEVHTTCWWHGEDPGSRGRLYINTDPAADIPGLFMCHVCGEKGSLAKIKKYFGDEVEVVEELSDERLAIFAEAAQYYHHTLADHEDAYTYLRVKRGFTVETTVKHQLGWADGHLFRHLRKQGFKTSQILETGLVAENPKSQRLEDSLQNMITIPYLVAGNVVQIRGRTFPYKDDGYPTEIPGPKYKTPPGQPARLFNSDVTWETDEVIVCEGEFDCISLEQHGFRAVGVPGARIWQDAWDGYMTKIRRIFIVFDDDAAGRGGAEKMHARFGPKVKAMWMPLPESGGKIDPTTWFISGRTAEEFRELLEQAARGGLLLTVDDAWDQHQELLGKPGLQLGIPELDSAIFPGVVETQVLVLLAKTGVGKTIWLLNTFQSIVDLQPEARILFVSLEQTAGEWFERARRIFRFWNQDKNDTDCLNFWRERLQIVEKNRLTMTELESCLDDYEYRTGYHPDLVAIDYLGYWAQSFKGERYERTADAIMGIKALAKDRRLRVAAPHQVSRVAKFGEEPEVDAARDAGVVEETADYVFTLWTPDMHKGKNPDQNTGQVNLRVGKSRHGGRNKKVEFVFAPKSLVLVPKEHDYARFARNEVQMPNTETWEEAIYRHRTRYTGTDVKADMARRQPQGQAVPMDIAEDRVMEEQF